MAKKQSAAELRIIDQSCDEFESAWQNESKPRIEDFLSRVNPVLRQPLFCEILSLELAYRQDAGLVSDPNEYSQRFPDYQDLISELFQNSQAAISSMSIQGVDTWSPQNNSAFDSINDDKYERPGTDRYENLQPFARGGLGEVFLAHDRELNRQVAIKQIQPRFANVAESRDRFLREAEITGGLQHPGVVSVYSLGADHKKHPYYAMRLVKGDTLLEAIDRFHESPESRHLQRNRLLRSFVDVCNTIAFAHSEGVIHRDIKPANILLGEYGETQIIDWGLAKKLADAKSSNSTGLKEKTAPDDSSLHETLDGSVFGTPGYMSPEQAEGRIQNTGVRSDVFSLGATLFHLLCGKIAFEGATSRQLLDNVVACRFDSSRLRQAETPRQLEAICLKAMSRDPDSRYSSAKELADEIDRHLADEPVAAFPENLFRRFSRWTRRHRTLMTTTIAAGAVLILSLAIGLVMVNNAKHNETLAKNRERNAKSLAQDRSRESKRYFRMARAAVDRLLSRIAAEELLKTAAFESFRQDLLLASLDFYHELVGDRPDDPELKADLGHAHQSLAKIQAELGKRKEAITEIKSAIEIFEDIRSETDAPEDTNAVLASLHSNLGTQYQRRSRYDQAQKSFEQSISMARAIVKQSPRSPKHLVLLASILNDAGSFYLTSAAQAAKAEECLTEAVKLFESFDSPGSAQQTAYRQARINLALAFAHRGERIRCVQILSDVTNEVETLVDEFPHNRSIREMFARIQMNIGNYSLDRKKSIEHIQTAIAQYQLLTERFPDVVHYRSKLALGQANMSRRLRDSGKLNEAIEFADRSLQSLEPLMKEHGADRMNQRVAAAVHAEKAFALTLTNKPVQRTQHLQLAIGFFEPLYSKKVIGFTEMGVYANCLNMLCHDLSNTASGDQILSLNENAMAIAQLLYEEQPEEPFHVFLLAYAHLIDYQGHRLNGELSKSRNALASSIAFYEEIQSKHPDYQKNVIGPTIKSLKTILKQMKNDGDSNHNES